MGTEEKTVKNITDDDNYSVPVSEEESTLSEEVDEVEDLEDKVEDLEGEVEDLEDEVADLEDEVEDLEGEVEDLEDEVADLEDEVEDLEIEDLEEPQEEQEKPRPEGTEWYVIHSYSGYENKVQKNLLHRIESMGMQDKIFQIVVPTEEEVELRDGQRRIIERRVFPGYILVEMILDEDSWYVVRNTPGVTGFVGSGNSPTPLQPDEVDRILKRMDAEAPKIKISFKVGQKVRIVEGPFEDFMGTVDEIDLDRTRVRVLVNFFGRETPIELDFLQVERA
jgi:transcriptional antiterminator NusG